MEAKKNKVCKQYLKDIKKNLTCSVSIKAVAMKDLREQILSYAEGFDGELTVEHLVERFGVAKVVGESFFSKNDLEELRERAKKYVVWKSVGIAAMVLLVLAVAFAWYLIDSRVYLVISEVHS